MTTTICDYGGGICPKPATHAAVTTRPDGTIVETRPMCHGHAVYVAMIYRNTVVCEGADAEVSW